MKVLFLDVDGVITVNDGSGTICQAKLKRLQSVVQQTQSVICISSNWRLFPQLKHRLTMVLQQYGMRVIGATPDHGERTHGRAVRAPSPRSRPLPLLPFLHPFLHSPPVPLIWTGYGITLQPRLQEPDYHTVNKLTPSSPRLPQVRPEEIVAWIRGWRGEPIEVWCAVDDRPLLSESGGKCLEGHFVQVDERHGITERAAERLSSLLVIEPDESDDEVAGATAGLSITTPTTTAVDEARLSPDSVLSPLSSLYPRTPPKQLVLQPLTPELPPGRRAFATSCPGTRVTMPRGGAERGSPPQRGGGAAETRADLTLVGMPRTGGVPSRRAQSAVQPTPLFSTSRQPLGQPFAPNPARRLSYPQPAPPAPRQQRPAYSVGAARQTDAFAQAGRAPLLSPPPPITSLTPPTALSPPRDRSHPSVRHRGPNPSVLQTRTTSSSTTSTTGTTLARGRGSATILSTPPPPSPRAAGALPPLPPPPPPAQRPSVPTSRPLSSPLARFHCLGTRL